MEREVAFFQIRVKSLRTGSIAVDSSRLGVGRTMGYLIIK